MPILNERKSSDHRGNEFRDTIKELFGPLSKDFKYNPPENLPILNDFNKLRPQKEWAIESLKKGLDRALWSDHGDGHVARVTIYLHLLMAMMEENGREPLTKEQKAAIVLSGVTHDLRYGSDRWEPMKLALTKKSGHQARAAGKEWLGSVFVELAQKEVSLFSGVESDKVIQLTSQINRVHDYTSSFRALVILKEEFPDANIKEIPLELKIFRDIDSGLERLRLEGLYNKVGPVAAEIISRVLRQGTLNPKVEKSLLHLLHFPHFEETGQLLPFAMQLFHKSIRNPEFKKDQWETTIKIAKDLGIFKA